MSRRSIILIVLVGAVVAFYILYFPPESPEADRQAESRIDSTERVQVQDTERVQVQDTERVQVQDTERVEEQDTVDDDRPVYDETENIAPGTAKLEMEIREVEQTAEKVYLIVKAGRKLGYGSATPPIGAGAELKINATGYYKMEPESIDTLEAGDQLVALISTSSQPGIEGLQEEKRSWNLARIGN